MPGCTSFNRSVQLETLCTNISSIFNSTASAREYLHLGTNLHLARFLKPEGHFAHKYFLTLGLGVAMCLVLVLVVATSTPRLGAHLQTSLRSCWGREDQEDALASRDD